MRGAAKRLALETAGWLLVVGGIAAMVLPGPGLLMLFAGMALLATQYEWAERRLAPIRLRALRGAAESVETWPRIVLSTVIALWVGGCGVVWLVRPPAPEWWPLAATWWLFGGSWTGVTLIASFFVAVALLVYSYRRFHGKPEALADLERDIEKSDDVVEALKHGDRSRDRP